jgi:hypothetical protein
MRQATGLAALLLVLGAGGPAAWAQDAGVTASTSTIPEPPAPISAVAPSPATVPGVQATAGTQILIELGEAISTRTIKRGDMFAIRLVSPLMVGDKVVVPAGGEDKGQVVDAAPSRALGTPAKLLLAARYLDFSGGRIPLRAMKFGETGHDESLAVFAAIFIPYVGILADFAHGGEIDVPAGTRAIAKLAADVDSPVASPTPAATVPPAAPTSTP